MRLSYLLSFALGWLRGVSDIFCYRFEVCWHEILGGEMLTEDFCDCSNSNPTRTDLFS